MHISLRARLDSTRDRFVIELEAGKVAETAKVAVAGWKESVEIGLDAEGYILQVSIPGLNKFFKELAEP
jgi:hypothetical protein